MRLVCLSDTHGRHRDLKLPPGDVLLHAGDVTARGHERETREFLDWFSAVGTYRHRVMTPGNHDRFFEQQPERARAMLPGNVTLLIDQGVTLAGLRLWGSPYTPVFHDWSFMGTPPQLAQHWDRIPGGLDVLVTHGPPQGTLDRVWPTGVPVGCPLLAQAVRRTHPRVHLLGHIHEGYGVTAEEETLFVNASSVDRLYRPINPPVVLDLEPGGPARIVETVRRAQKPEREHQLQGSGPDPPSLDAVKEDT